MEDKKIKTDEILITMRHNNSICILLDAMCAKEENKEEKAPFALSCMYPMHALDITISRVGEPNLYLYGHTIKLLGKKKFFFNENKNERLFWFKWEYEDMLMNIRRFITSRQSGQELFQFCESGYSEITVGKKEIPFFVEYIKSMQEKLDQYL